MSAPPLGRCRRSRSRSVRSAAMPQRPPSRPPGAAHRARDAHPSHCHHRVGVRWHRDGLSPASGRDRDLHHLREGRVGGRHLARQHLPRSGMRRPVAPVLALVRTQDRLDPEVPRAARDPRLPQRGHRPLRPAFSPAPRGPRSPPPHGTTTPLEHLDLRRRHHPRGRRLGGGHRSAQPAAHPRHRRVSTSSPDRRSTRRAGTTTTTCAASGSPSSASGRAPSSSCHAIAKVARQLTLFQRSSNYVAPKPDGEFSEAARERFRRHRLLQRLYRFSIWARFDARWLVFRKGSKLAAMLGEKRFAAELWPRSVSDDLPAEALLPDYPLGCKRILISNDWYPTLFRPNVEVVTAPVERITRLGVVAGGVEHPADTIIFGTGFASTGFLAPSASPVAAADLHDEWHDGAEAHLGITVAGFPNLFVLYGPNTNLGHNSIVFMLERQISYALTWIRRLIEEDRASVEVREPAQAASNERLQRHLARTVWAAVLPLLVQDRAGKITNNWSGPTIAYWWRTRDPVRRLRHRLRRPSPATPLRPFGDGRGPRNRVGAIGPASLRAPPPCPSRRPPNDHRARTRRSHRRSRPDRLQPAVPHRQRCAARPRHPGHPAACSRSPRPWARSTAWPWSSRTAPSRCSPAS